jgi:hypothetical protein
MLVRNDTRRATQNFCLQKAAIREGRVRALVRSEQAQRDKKGAIDRGAPLRNLVWRKNSHVSACDLRDARTSPRTFVTYALSKPE